MLKRSFDFTSSLIALILLSPFLILIGLMISIESKGGPFFMQQRVGLNKRPFRLIKFRSMVASSEVKGQLTVGNSDPRITKSGKFIRRFKIDELPQLINVLIGQMSIVGPRPEVSKYVELYDENQIKVLSVRPGLTDYASIEYIDEDKLLGEAKDPESLYIDEIMPAKLKLNLKYINDKGMLTDLKIIFRTIGKIFR